MLGILSDMIRRATLTHPVDRERHNWDAPRHWQDQTWAPRHHLNLGEGRRDD